jgi:DNA mismatch repair protein MutL
MHTNNNTSSSVSDTVFQHRTTTESGTSTSTSGEAPLRNVNDNHHPHHPHPHHRPNNRIQILSSRVIEQIAAGEIVQHTYLAIKELLENSMDAHASQIRITVHHNSKNNGGGCSFTVTDNGMGITEMDLPLACTRHATSKITSHLDLIKSTSSTSLNHTDSTMTFGFRGEALAAISMVARNITITSRTAVSSSSTSSTTEATSSSTHNHPMDTLAYQMQYQNGQPLTHIPMKRVPRSTIGTTIQVQDLFYNTPQRQILPSSQEYHKILQIVQYYAIHSAARGIVLICERHSSSSGTVNNTSTPVVVTDLNTTPWVSLQDHQIRRPPSSQLPPSSPQSQLQSSATISVIGHTMGSQIIPYLLYHSSELYMDGNTETNMATAVSNNSSIDGNIDRNNDLHSTTASTTNTNHNQDVDPTREWIYHCTGYITSPK